MRLHSLEITAFGPFAGTEKVDFDALGADGLFLLHGRTGAGKTTVLDAVAFALYGTVPGARKEGKRLLSDHAEIGAVPTVTLEATLGGRRIRIVRSPEFHRPKKRGTGTTKQNAKASMTWLDGKSQNLTRLDEIGDAVGAALGMSADQFFQVVLLPQGEFARFLRADSDERGNLLERLFDTARFGDIEEWFAEQRRTSAAALESSRIATDKLLGQISTASGVAEELDRPPVEWAGDVLESARHASVDAARTLALAREVSESATKELAALDATRQLQTRRELARQQLAEFHAAASARDALAKELEQSAAAGPIAALAADCARITSASEAATREFDSVRTLFERTEGSTVVLDALAVDRSPDASDTPEARAVVAAAVRQWTTEVAAFEELRVLTRKADAADRSARSLLAEHAAVEKKSSAHRADRNVLPEQIAQAESSLRAAVHAAAEVPALEAEWSRITSAVEAAIELAKTRKRLVAAEKAHHVAVASFNDARAHTLDLREQRLSGMAAELASSLVDGAPCGVCGSLSHPAPTRAEESTVTKDDEADAAASERRAGTIAEKKAEEVTALLRTRDVLVQQSGDRDSAELVASLDKVSVALRSARTAAEQRESLDARLTHLRGEDQRLAAAIADEQAAAAGLSARAAQMADDVAQMRATIAAAVDGTEGIDAEVKRLETLISLSSVVVERREEASRALLDMEDVTRRLDALIAESGFSTAREAAAAVVSPARAQSIEKQLAQANDIRAHAEQVLAEPAIAAVANLDPVDTAAARVAVEDAQVRLHAAVAEHAECKRRAEQLEELTAGLWAAIDRAAPMQTKHDELAALADVVAGRGQNSRKMSLRSYVLASRLEEVAESASARLRRMSSGRYDFVHSDEAESRGRRGGLGLDIRDDYTGAVRSAKTLSGGESFLASLALALGLADVVAAESGGVVLDTMFIDEGFGTLDADTLESVMGVLDELRAGGRVVGIVSHVDEMRQRIPTRLHVIREREGSRLQLFAAS
ncbi:ATP-dependent dsDNA exonuclease [Rhodococcus sp. RS1C4]|uniref:AAA family ATPase n=1 Tax=Nocardiaceae TaxID=85025 RepID=UPI00036BE5D0|nr:MULTISPECIES: SMC family ATPase [Rhodococcus]OZC50389.1 ATP-dependent dsDNA exonuclease [Rhodococcus sp. RS1C4]OZD14191.1 ATP-dependent dsDNA exonuclease [Rhodococcus sp. 06-156-3C]OZD15882.1 ATP-dependent dsDNA exonuclease [Rhodococcus sp. 06-156-4C]OZD24527.1 ATP-dependent dsDNA exonuclease [Rhodococcus sp. 06-156-3b]OZD28482.1 ATP-dependent dsDNA exonuclease [Rhodococcus sp. 06-156-4a]